MNQAIRRTVQTIHGFLIEEPSVFLACSRSQPDEQALFFEKGSHQRDRGFCRFFYPSARFQCRQLPPGCYLKIEARPVLWPLLRRSEPAQSCQISLALCSEWHPQQLRCEDSTVFRPYLCGRRRPQIHHRHFRAALPRSHRSFQEPGSRSVAEPECGNGDRCRSPDKTR